MLHTEGLAEGLRAVGGHTGVCIRSLVTGEAWNARADEPIEAASVIKLLVMAEAYRQREEGTLSFSETHVLRDEERLPSCGTLQAMHTGIGVTVGDLVALMILVSDNTATNILIRRLGMDRINDCAVSLGLTATRLNRLLFDAEAAGRGVINTVSASDCASLLERIYRGTLVSANASREMLDLLKEQQLNGKLPFYLHPAGIEVAHKTGEDENLTHDVGILFSEEPIVCCMLGERLDTPSYIRLMQDTARALCLTDLGRRK